MRVGPIVRLFWVVCLSISTVSCAYGVPIASELLSSIPADKPQSLTHNDTISSIASCDLASLFSQNWFHLASDQLIFVPVETLSREPPLCAFAHYFVAPCCLNLAADQTIGVELVTPPGHRFKSYGKLSCESSSSSLTEQAISRSCSRLRLEASQERSWVFVSPAADLASLLTADHTDCRGSTEARANCLDDLLRIFKESPSLSYRLAAAILLARHYFRSFFY